MPQYVAVTCSAHGQEPRRVVELAVVTPADADADLDAQRRHAALTTAVLGTRPGWVAHEPRRASTGITLRRSQVLKRPGRPLDRRVAWSPTVGAACSVVNGADGWRRFILRCPHPDCRPVVVTERDAVRLVAAGREVDLDTLRRRRQGRTRS